jgi:hypothetical protein
MASNRECKSLAGFGEQSTGFAVLSGRAGMLALPGFERAYHEPVTSLRILEAKTR